MRKVIRTIVLFSLPLLVACGGGSSKEDGELEIVNEAPSTVSLELPTDKLLCIDNEITFDWSDATDANNDNITYKITIAKDRGLTNIAESKTINSSSISFNLEKGVAYYWGITAVDSKGKSGVPSSVYSFYTKGEGETNALPFASKLVSPADEDLLDATIVSVALKWIGADSDTDDTLSYEVFFGEDVNLTDVISSQEEESYSVTVATGKTYYWKVNTIDNSGGKSIGQVWSFSVN